METPLNSIQRASDENFLKAKFPFNAQTCIRDQNSKNRTDLGFSRVVNTSFVTKIINELLKGKDPLEK